jgi:NADH:ubiquinone oxidoreductase subunit 6 (subunit J)
MSDVASVGLFWGLSAVALFGALAVVFVRDVMRMALGLGAFLMAVAGFFAYYGFGFLALAELFVYVGGVLVLVLFAIMLRCSGGRRLVRDGVAPRGDLRFCSSRVRRTEPVRGAARAAAAAV